MAINPEQDARNVDRGQRAQTAAGIMRQIENNYKRSEAARRPPPAPMKWPDPVRIDTKQKPASRKKARRVDPAPIYYEPTVQYSPPPVATYSNSSPSNFWDGIALFFGAIAAIVTLGSSSWVKKLVSGLVSTLIFLFMCLTPFMVHDEHPAIFFKTVVVIGVGALVGYGLLLFFEHRKVVARGYGEHIGIGRGIGLALLTASVSLMVVIWSSVVEYFVLLPPQQ